MKQKTIGLVALLILVVVLSGAFAEMIQPYASEVIATTGITSSPRSGGEVRFTVNITGTDVMKKLGFPSIEIQEKNGNVWSCKKEVTNKFKYNSAAYSYSVSYSGTAGKQYRCIASFSASDGSVTDTRVRTSSAITAKN